MGKKLLISFTGLLLFGVLLNAQGVFTARAPAVVRVGEQFQYMIEGSERGNIRFPAMDNFELLGGPYSSFSSHSQWINGKMTQKTLVSYTYMLSALREGSYVIPASTVKVGRKEYRTNVVELVVNASGSGAGRDQQGAEDGSGISSSEDNAVFLRVLPSKTEVYVGEQFVSALKVYTRVNTRPGSAASDLPYEGFYKLSLDADATAQQQEISGQEYITQVIQRHILIPQKTGNLEITTYESDWMIPQKVQRQRSNNPIDNFFDDPFFNGIQEVPITIATRPVIIHVKPLPTGTPVGFTGAVASLPGCTTLVSPLDGEINVPLTPLIEWAAVAGAAGYKVTIGSSPFTTEVLDNVVFSTNSTFVIDFEPNRTFFITIIPFNAAGEAIGCGQESFSTIVGCGPYFDSVTGELIIINPEISFPDTISFCQDELPFLVSSTDTAEEFSWEP